MDRYMVEIQRLLYSCTVKTSFKGKQRSGLSHFNYYGSPYITSHTVHRLDHCDVISLLMLDFPLYYFLHQEHMKQQFPVNLISKYLVGRVLGSRALLW